jgi:L-serine deaminase
MVETGKDLDMEYRETSLGGLAKHKIINWYKN